MKQQELELDNVAKLHKEEQREEGRKQKAVQKVWRDKEKTLNPKVMPGASSHATGYMTC